MSATQDHNISDIHQHPTSVAETLSVTTSESVVPSSIVQHVTLNTEVPVSPISLQQPLTVNVTVPSDQVQQPLHSVGAGIGDSQNSVAGSIADRASTALLNIASNSLNLTEILNAQQQALEQFQCQLQLAQQTETINQRLDAIERTLNSLIQQKAQEDALKTQSHIHHHQSHIVQLDALSPVTPVHQSPQLQLGTPDKLGLLSDHSLSGESRKKKLPRELCSKVRSTYHTLNLEFKIDERFLSPANQRVTDTLIDTVFTDTNGGYTAKDIKRSVHRYYESRRRLGIEELPDRQGKAAEQKKKRKYRARQQRAHDRRRKYVRESEVQYWQYVSPSCMTEESDSEQGERILTHQLLWRSEFLNQFVIKLDNRYDKSKKPGAGSTVKRTRVPGLPSTSQPPHNLPSWMIDPSYKMTMSSTMCLEDSTLDSQSTPSVTDDIANYTTLITDVQEVHDDSSDFELPDTVVA